MPIYRDTDTIHERVDGGHNLILSCHAKEGCSAKLPFFLPSGEKPVPFRSLLREHGWEETKGKTTRYFCPEHRIVSPEEQHRKKLAEFIQTRISIDEHDSVPTARVWDEFRRYVGLELADSIEFTLGKRDVYAAVRALGDTVKDGVLNLAINGKQTSTPIFKGISLKTTTAPQGHSEWFAKQKGGVLATSREVKAAKLEYHRNRAERRRTAARKGPTPAELVAQFVQEHLAPNGEAEPMASDAMYRLFGRFIAGQEAEPITKREMMSLLTRHGLKARKSSRRVNGKPTGFTVYDGVGAVNVLGLPGAPAQTPDFIACDGLRCPETARDDARAGALGWRRVDGEVFCLIHAVDHEADLEATTWPTRAPDLDTSGPRGREASASIDDEIVLDEDRPDGWSPDKVVRPTDDQDFESIAAEFEAMPETGTIDDDEEYLYPGDPGYED